jgi:hypothetical protein
MDKRTGWMTAGASRREVLRPDSACHSEYRPVSGNRGCQTHGVGGGNTPSRADQGEARAAATLLPGAAKSWLSAAATRWSRSSGLNPEQRVPSLEDTFQLVVQHLSPRL